MPKILIIDDDVQLCTALQVHLEKENHAVLVVDSGVGALQAAEEENPNLILLDLAIPGLDGIEVLNQLKHSVITWDIPVMIVTAQGDLDDRERTLRMGATRYLQKPLSPKDLAIEIADLLRGSEAPA
jgi:DNA-binding response OmpR family regulator